ncbi:Spy/CpxP family protein refolding chaperone [Granulicella sp. dw_53]|uniref:Spy/CpxP family protein refolding chaperone n=1 Tax=Granulicella sp. dw_53 TaxID=2719792 RepID=UPI001BD447DE|nr:Spy/CpxP family protein refolding chaperone [Granulicella sp. dw_53]
MTTRPIFTLFSVALLSASCAIAQQPAPPSPDSAPGATAPAPPRRGGPEKRDMRMEGGGGGGMRPGSRLGPPGMWWKNPDVIQRLTLTPEQQTRMDDIFQKSRLQLIDLKANLEKQEVILEPMLDANPPDTNKVLSQIDHVAQARAELEKANARMLLGIRSVLTADQWTKLQTSERGHHRMFRGPGGPGMQGGGPEGPGRFGSSTSGGHDFHFSAPEEDLETAQAQ